MATYNGQVQGGGLNLRSSASTSASSPIQIPNGSSIVVSDYSANTSWYCTTYGGHSGFVMKTYVTIISNVATRSCNVTGGGLNLRLYPNTAASSPIQIPNNQPLTVQKHNDTWSSTTYGGYSGFVMSQYLTGSSGGGTTPTTGLFYAKVTTSGGTLTVRKGAGTGYEAWGAIPNGRILICEDSGTTGWYKTRFAGSTAYVSASFMTKQSTAVHSGYVARCKHIYTGELGNNKASYYDNASGAWCQYFVNWLLRSSYMATGRVPTTGGTGYGIQFWVRNANFYFKNATHKARINGDSRYNLNVGTTLTTAEKNYVPSEGDIIYLRWSNESDPSVNVNHTGFVTSVSGGYAYTVEGNAGANLNVYTRKFALTDTQIVGYGKPNYS